MTVDQTTLGHWLAWEFALADFEAGRFRLCGLTRGGRGYSGQVLKASGKRFYEEGRLSRLSKWFWRLLPKAG